MFNSLYNISSIRILIYFLNNVKKIKALLSYNKDITLVRTLKRGQGTLPNVLNLRKHIK